MVTKEKSFENQINEYMENQLKNCDMENQKPKIIREALFGINKYHGWEVNLLDLPPLQRLRNIHQNGLTFFTYPTAIQTRFDHTLGVLTLAGKYIDALKLKSNVVSIQNEYMIRISALLHDIGHGPFSHLSEEVYSSIEPLKSIKKKKPFTQGGSDSKPHEILSYFMIKSPALGEKISKLQELYKDQIKDPLDIDKISQSIIGKMKINEDKYFQDIINGAFDADKLDYIQRDCYFSGLKMSIDLDRIFYGLEIDAREKKKGVIINISGVHNLEQLLFNKILLNPSIYHHHKVRATSCMFKSIFEIIEDNNLEIDGLKFDNVIDFLKIDDNFFQNYQNKPPILRDYLENIFNRSLLKRALVISMKTIAGDENSIKLGYERLLKWQEDDKKIKEFRLKLAEKINSDPTCVQKVSYYDLWLDIPKISSTREVSQFNVKIMDNEYKRFNELIPIDNWLETYQQIQFRGNIFCPAIPEIRKATAKHAKKILQDELQLVLNNDAEKLAKIPGL